MRVARQAPRSQDPAQREADVCLHWLESEIELVQPVALLALGAVAARSLLGRHVAVMSERGRWHEDASGQQVLVTLHPSALLRGDPEQRASAWKAWLDDLSQASAIFEKVPPRARKRAKPARAVKAAAETA